jgi:hypothetical protein
MNSRNSRLILAALALVAAGMQAQPNRPDAARLREEVNEWTSRLRGAPTARAAGIPLREAAVRRAGALVELMRAAPSAAYAARLSPEERQALVAQDPGLDALLEAHGRWRGDVQALAVDDFERGAGWTEHFLSGKDLRLEVHAIGRPLPGECGWTAEFEGIALNGVAAGFLLSLERAAGEGDCSNIGEQRTLGVAVSFPGKELTLTESQISSLLLAPAAPSLDHFLREQTRGQTWVSGTVASVQLDRSYSCSEYSELADAVFRALSERDDLTQYRRFFLFFPVGTGESCAWAGLGSLNCWRGLLGSPHWHSISWISVRSAPVGPRVVHHEAGHNFGLQHSSSRRFSGLALGAPGQRGELSEYGDPFTVMGSGWASFNVRQKQHAGWLAGAQVLQVEGTGTYTIEPVGSASAGPKALRIRRQAGQDAWLWVEYHRPQGPYYETWPKTAVPGALVYYEDGVNSDPTQFIGAWTHLLDMTPGSSWDDFQDGTLAAGKLWRDRYTGLDLQVDAAGESLTVSVRRETPCATVEPGMRRHGPGAESGEIRVSAPLACGWDVFVSEPWIKLSGQASGNGSGTVAYRLEANGGAELRRGYLAIGRNTVVLEQLPVNQPPVAVSVDPSAGSAPDLALRVQIQDPNGPEDVAWVAVRVSQDQGGGAACHLEYDVAQSEVRLATEDGSGWIRAKAGYSLSLENRYCRVLSCSFYTSGPG